MSWRTQHTSPTTLLAAYAHNSGAHNNLAVSIEPDAEQTEAFNSLVACPRLRTIRTTFMHYLKTRSLEKLATLSKIVIALLVHYAQGVVARGAQYSQKNCLELCCSPIDRLDKEA